MAEPKYHWAIPVSDPSKHPHAWRALAGGYYAQACGRRKKSAVGYPAERFFSKSQRRPDCYCADCAKAARLALAKESAPKPNPPACKSERTDSDRYAELRALVEAWQSHQAGSSTALAEWNHR